MRPIRVDGAIRLNGSARKTEPSQTIFFAFKQESFIHVAMKPNICIKWRIDKNGDAVVVAISIHVAKSTAHSAFFSTA